MIAYCGQGENSGGKEMNGNHRKKTNCLGRLGPDALGDRVGCSGWASVRSRSLVEKTTTTWYLFKGTEHSFLLGSWIVFDCDVERPTLGSFLLTVLLIGLVSARDWDLT